MNSGTHQTSKRKPQTKINQHLSYAMFMSTCSPFRPQGVIPQVHLHKKKAVYAVIKGLLALFHSDVDSSAWRSSPKKHSAANDLYFDFCSHEMQTLASDATSLELLALAVRQQILADRMDRPRHIPRYLKYFADFAERALCSSLIVRTTSASQCTTAAAGNQ